MKTELDLIKETAITSERLCFLLATIEKRKFKDININKPTHLKEVAFLMKTISEEMYKEVGRNS